MTARQIAIDGPSAAGKSTVAKAVAQRLGYLYIDTGAMYRAVALMAIRSDIAFDDQAALSELTGSLDIRLEHSGQDYRVYVNDEDVSQEIRLPEVGNAASPISAVCRVRQLLVEMQQQMAAKMPVVMDGRDIGTVVLPDAQLKIFLTADTRERARRRALELKEKGIEVDIEEVERDIIARDYRDSHRENSPLKQTDDAYVLDNSQMTAEEVVEKIVALAEAR